jgi:bilin biosynthesis protein
MDNNRFSNIHLGLSKEEAIRILASSIDQLDSNSDYYMAAAHLLNFPGPDTEAALINLLEMNDDSQPIRLAQRKAVEVLGILGCQRSIPLIAKCLESSDSYLVENAAWALKELNCQDQNIINSLINLLHEQDQNYRVIIQALKGLGAKDACDAIRIHLASENPGVRGAAIASLAILTGEKNELDSLKDYLTLPNQMDRQSAIQDIIDANYYDFLPDVLTAPVSPVFRMRAVKALWPKNQEDLNGNTLDYFIDAILLDNPNNLDLVHRYDQTPELDFLIQEFFGSDFSRCYLALSTLAKFNMEQLWPLMINRWQIDAYNDYGAHYFFMRLMGQAVNWRVEDIKDGVEILLEAISNPRPQFLKSKPAAILALFKIYPQLAISNLTTWLDHSKTSFWEARYTALLGWQSVISANQPELNSCVNIHDLRDLSLADPEKFVNYKAAKLFA